MKFSEKDLLLYGVTDRSWLGNETLYEQVEKALKGGVTFLQLREKDLEYDRFLREGKELKKLCERYGVPFVINDDVDVALACDADGVHVGQEDMAAEEARRRMGQGKILGVSVQTVDQAVKAEATGADYLGVGAVFPTGSKADAEEVDHGTVREICDKVNIPVIAIGGIGPHNVMELAGTGICGIAVISGIFSREDIRGAAEELKQLTEKMVEIPMYKGIIFDMDGVLLDSMPHWETAAGRYLSTLGIAADPDLEKRMFAMTMEEGAAYLKERYALVQEPEEIRAGVNRAITESYETMIPLKPGVMDFLQRQKKRGVPMTVATSTDEGPAMAALTRLEVLPFFAQILTVSQVGEGKHSPKIYLEAAEAMGVDAKDTMVFEDAVHAAATAKEAGFIVMGVGDVFSKDREEELRELSHGFIHSFEEI
ncbi:MAG: thiamine phosphate synthase [Anaerovoracaceae bacterium]|jgi:thiamine-phosphate diphosphorylase